MSVHDTVREVIATSTEADPAKLADVVCAQVAEEHLRTALREAVGHLVRQAITSSRSRAFSGPEALPGPSQDVLPVGPRRMPARSAKRDAVADWWQGVLRERIHVGDGRWEFLGDANRGDLLCAAQERQMQGRALLARAAQFEAIADLMVRHSVIRVRDLPQNAVAGALTRKAPAAA